MYIFIDRYYYFIYCYRIPAIAIEINPRLARTDKYELNW
jgi:hypothetical protein